MVSPFVANSLKNRIFFVVQSLAEQSSVSVSPEYITSVPITGGKKPTKQQSAQPPTAQSESTMAATMAVVNGDASTSTAAFSANQGSSAPATTTTTAPAATGAGMAGSGTY